MGRKKSSEPDRCAEPLRKSPRIKAQKLNAEEEPSGTKTEETVKTKAVETSKKQPEEKKDTQTEKAEDTVANGDTQTKETTTVPEKNEDNNADDKVTE